MLARVRPLPWAVLAVVLVAVAASITGLANGFAYDDIPIIVDNPMVTALHTPAEFLTDSYWGPARGNSLYRPVTIAAFSLQWAAGSGAPVVFHATSIVLYAASAVALLLLLRVLLPAGPALLGAMAWAAHPVHVEAVANVVGQSEMLAAIPMLVATALYVRARMAGSIGRGTTAAIVACYALALLSKEHGIVLPGLLAAAEFTWRARTPPAGTPWPLVRWMGLVTVIYVVVRISILGGFAGDTPHPSWEGLGAGERAWVMLAMVPEVARLLLWPARLHADYSPNAIPFATAPAAAHLLGLAWLLAWGALLAWGWRRERTVAFALLWLVVTVAPVSNLLIPTGVILAERTLFLPSATIAMLVGVAAARLMPWMRTQKSPVVRFGIPATAAALLAAGIARSASRSPVWLDNTELFATMVAEAPTNYRARHALGELFGASRAWKRAEAEFRIAHEINPRYELISLSLARALHFDARCGEALPFYDQVLAKRPDAEVASIGRAACLIEERQFTDARAEAVAGLARGLSPGPFGFLLQKAESSLVAWDTVDARNRWYRAGAPVSRSLTPLRVPVFVQRPGGASRARRMPESSP